MADEPQSSLGRYVTALRNAVDSLDEAAQAVQLSAFREGVLEALLDLLTKPITLTQLSEAVLFHALDDGRIGDSGSVFVLALTGGERKEVELLWKAVLAPDKQSIVPDHSVREYRRFAEGEGIAGHVLRTGQRYVTANCEADKVYKRFSSDPQLKSLLAVPIKYGGDVMGVLCVHSSATKVDFSESDVEFVKALANAASIVVRANYHPLTMLPSGALTNDLVEAAIEEATQTGRPLSLAYLDIDGFGRLNLDFGHDTANEAIRRVAAAMNEEIGQAASLCHPHGDEFVIIFRDQNREQAAATCERIRKRVERSTIQLGSETLKVTIKGGGAVWEPGMTAADLKNKADARNRAAKEKGGNTVEWQGEVEPQNT